MTYNVHRCTGRDGIVSPERIARVIAQVDPDIVALQEVDVHRQRTGGVDQVDVIARALGMRFHFNTVLRVEDSEGYGDAILTALPARRAKAARIPGRPRLPGVERRGALWVEIEVDGRPLQVITTHLGLSAGERRLQLDALLGEEWLNHPGCSQPQLLLGDFNAVPRSRAYRRLSKHLRDAQVVAGGRPRPTYPAAMPLLPLDYIFVSPPLRVLQAGVLRTKLARVASDHLPVFISAQFP
ncbi:MAG: endonuclease/exonuclease/phosphatase family protein [Acetobacterales bacterium]